MSDRPLTLAQDKEPKKLEVIGFLLTQIKSTAAILMKTNVLASIFK